MAGGEGVEAIIARIRAGGGRATDARRATIKVLLNTGQSHLSAEDIVSQVQLEHPEVAESTIYRNLATLEELGVVEHVHLGHGPSTYHLTDDGHQHLLCESCGKVIEVPDETFAPLAEQLAATYGFRIHARHFALMGLCRRCQTAAPTERPARALSAAGERAPVNVPTPREQRPAAATQR